MFEDEYRETTKSWKNARKIEFILSDASLLLPPTGTPLTGIEFTKRLPCGEVVGVIIIEEMNCMLVQSEG